MENLQEFLITKRNELKLSLRSAAEIIGISHSYLSTLEKGTDTRNNTPVKPTPETLQLISNAYGVSYEFLMKLAGYLIEDSAKKSELSEEEEKDVEKRIAKLKQDFYEKGEGFMLSGEPLSPEAMESILDALSFGIRQAKIINKKYTPKKYRK